MKYLRNTALIWLVALTTVLFAACTPTEEAPVVQDAILHIVSEQSTAYSLVVPEKASGTVSTAVSKLRNTVEDVTGVQLGWTDDYLEAGGAPAATEILIGLTNREESRRVLEETPYGTFSIQTVGEKIVVAGWDDNALAIACSKLVAYVEDTGKEGQLTFTNYSLTGKTFAGLDMLPIYGDGDKTVQFVDLADNSRMLLVKNTTPEEFNAYVNKLADAGFAEFATRKMGNNLFATFTGKDKIIQLTYNAYGRDVRVAVDPLCDMSLFTEQSYEKVCEPALHLLGLEFNTPSNPDEYVQNALGIIFRLEDGRFVIVDGNYFGDRQARELYEALCDLAVDKNDITVAAWIFTHAHNDHVGAFCTLADSQWKDKIKIENFLYHFTTAAQYKASGGSGALSDVRSAMRKYPDANHIKVHTGQVLKVGGAEIEILFTFADSEPTVLTNFNATSVVLRFITQGNTVLVPGDATDGDCNYLARKYGDYLKSDIVQITHHGYNGTALFYQTVDADVILWAGGARQFYGKDGLYRIKDWEHNKVALSLAEECYIAGETGHTLILPYTPKDNKTVKIYDGE